jgi:hypothetical protein
MGVLMMTGTPSASRTAWNSTFEPVARSVEGMRMIVEGRARGACPHPGTWRSASTTTRKAGGICRRLG